MAGGLLGLLGLLDHVFGSTSRMSQQVADRAVREGVEVPRTDRGSQTDVGSPQLDSETGWPEKMYRWKV